MWGRYGKRKVNSRTNFIKAEFQFAASVLHEVYQLLGRRQSPKFLFFFSLRAAEMVFLIPLFSLRGVIMATQSGFFNTNFMIQRKENRTQRTYAVFMGVSLCFCSVCLLPFPGKRCLCV